MLVYWYYFDSFCTYFTYSWSKFYSNYLFCCHYTIYLLKDHLFYKFRYSINKQSINYFVLPPFTLKEIRSIISGSVFPKVSMSLALTISIVADLLDYTAAPLLGMPIIGDVFDLIVMSMLYSITKSKVLFIMNLAEFVPFLGDFLPVYTASTIIWILRESGYDGLLIARRLLRLISNTQSHV